MISSYFINFWLVNPQSCRISQAMIHLNPEEYYVELQHRRFDLPPTFSRTKSRGWGMIPGRRSSLPGFFWIPLDSSVPLSLWCLQKIAQIQGLSRLDWLVQQIVSIRRWRLSRRRQLVSETSGGCWKSVDFSGNTKLGGTCFFFDLFDFLIQFLCG